MSSALLKVLVVEDEPLIRSMMEDALSEAGFDYVSAGTSDNALQRLENEEPAALVTDVNLGRGLKTGWEIARRAREKAPSIPVVYVTGDSAHQWSSHGVPGSILVPKPFFPAQLVTALAQLLNEAAQEKAKAGRLDDHGSG